MRRLLQFRILIVLIALALIPAATLPFAERLRSEWARFWEQKPEVEEPAIGLVEFRGSGAIYEVEPTRFYIRVGDTLQPIPGSATSADSSLRFSEAQELGEAAGSVDLPFPAIER